MTPASRLRLRVALWRFTLAEWIAPPAACIANRAEVNRLIRSDERRRALARRRLARRAARMNQEAIDYLFSDAPWWGEEEVIRTPGHYAPASACDLGYEVSGDGPRRE